MTTANETDYAVYADILGKWLNEAKDRQPQWDAWCEKALEMLSPALAQGWEHTTKPNMVAISYGPLTFCINARPCSQVQYSLSTHCVSHDLPLACGHGNDLGKLMDRAYRIAKHHNLTRA